MNLIRDHWQFAPIEELLTMVRQHWERDVNALTGTARIDESWTCPALTAWKNYALAQLVPLSPQGGKIECFCLCTPPTDEYWAHGYPHDHVWADNVLCTYLDPGGGAEPLYFLEDPAGDVDKVVPKPGLTIVFPGKARHGMRGNPDPHKRVTLMMASMPRDVQFSKPVEETASRD